MLTIQTVAEMYLVEIAKGNNLTNAKVKAIDPPDVLRGGAHRYTVHFVCDQHPDGDTFTIDQDRPPTLVH